MLSSPNYAGLAKVYCNLKVEALGWLEGAARDRGPGILIFHPHLRTETDSIPKRCVLLFFRIPDDGQIPKTQ
jgi:hypothetical protein